MSRAGTLAKILKRTGEKAAVGEVIALIEPSGKPREAAKSAKAPAAPAPSDASDTSAPSPRPAERKKEEPPVPAAREEGAPGRQEEAVPMTLLRRTVAQRLVEAQHHGPADDVQRDRHVRRHRLAQAIPGNVPRANTASSSGFMSFFVKAAVEALEGHPAGQRRDSRRTTSSIRNYYDIGIAIGGGKGLVVPVLRNAERMSFAEIEQADRRLGRRAPRTTSSSPRNLQGGTFTITNGGVYGSLLSTPIINPPQSGILGMHAIQERPVAVDGQVVIRPMMYVALTYDHRLVDGREAVTFLKRIKETIEKPARILLEV